MTGNIGSTLWCKIFGRRIGVLNLGGTAESTPSNYMPVDLTFLVWHDTTTVHGNTSSILGSLSHSQKLEYHRPNSAGLEYSQQISACGRVRPRLCLTCGCGRLNQVSMNPTIKKINHFPSLHIAGPETYLCILLRLKRTK